MLRGGAEQALQTAPQICGFADIRLGLGIVATKQKDCGRSGSGSEDFRVGSWDELAALGQHEVILV